MKRPYYIFSAGRIRRQQNTLFFEKAADASTDGIDPSVEPDEEILVDSRPSDAIALALRTNAPIFVDKSVMRQAGISDGSVREEPASLDFSSPEDILEQFRGQCHR